MLAAARRSAPAVGSIISIALIMAYQKKGCLAKICNHPIRQLADGKQAEGPTHTCCCLFRLGLLL